MKKKITLLSLLMALFLLPTKSFAYTVNHEFNLGANEGSSIRANNQYVLLHETANPTATGRNEAQYMKRAWANAYTSYIVGDGGMVYQVGEPGYVQYGAGSYANSNAPVQIELQHTKDKVTFEKNYKTYVELARDSATRFGIPKTLDSPWNQPGIKSHLWVTNNIWGDHTDPYGYLASMGVTQSKLAYDLEHGFGSNNPVPNPAPSKPNTVDPLRAGSTQPVTNDGNNHGMLDLFGENPKDMLLATGWHIANYQYEYIFIMDYNTGKELSRIKAPGVSRPNVNQVYGTKGNVGFGVRFNLKQFKGKKIYLMMRATNDPTGNTKGGFNDIHRKGWYYTLK